MDLPMTNLASIDIGTHTARLLVCEKIGPPGLLRELVRKRGYVRLAEGSGNQGKEIIGPEAIDRTLKVLEDFAYTAKKFNVDNPHAVSTGVVRTAVNRDHFLSLIHQRTGIKVKVISGDQEAYLTGQGVLHSLDIQDGETFMIFDLGGGSTEFVFGVREDTKFKSIPLGAMILTRRFFPKDPPEGHDIEALVSYVDEVLKGAFPEEAHTGDAHFLVGTGGTATTLAAMTYRIETKAISPARMNGLNLKREQIEDLLEQVRPLRLQERLGLPGLDGSRASVILAGLIVVNRILDFFGVLQMVVSLSDILEGILLVDLQGEEDE